MTETSNYLMLMAEKLLQLKLTLGEMTNNGREK